MKIAFWSNGKENIGVTSNLACISVTVAFTYPYKAVLMENHLQKNKLEKLLLYHFPSYRREVQYQSGNIGLGHVINHFAREDSLEYNKKDNIIKKASLEVLSNSLYYIPLDYVQNQMSFDYNLSRSIKKILNDTENFADITYIDTSGKDCLSSKIILEEADLVVVSLAQNVYQIEKFFDEYSSILYKCIFLITNYQKKSNENISKIFREYSIDKSQVVGIPFNEEYQAAIYQGRVVEFVTRNYKCSKKNPNYSFVFRIKKAVDMIVKHIEEYSL